MDRGAHRLRSSELGQVSITSKALAQMIGRAAAESYGVVGMAGRRLARVRLREHVTDGIAVRGGTRGLEIDLHVIVEYGLNLAEVASSVRSRVAYEIRRQTGLEVSAVEVRIEDVRRS